MRALRASAPPSLSVSVPRSVARFSSNWSHADLLVAVPPLRVVARVSLPRAAENSAPHAPAALGPPTADAEGSPADAVARSAAPLVTFLPCRYGLTPEEVAAIVLPEPVKSLHASATIASRSGIRPRPGKVRGEGRRSSGQQSFPLYLSRCHQCLCT